MWLMTDKGFYSAIRWHDGRICIRARRRDDLERLEGIVPNMTSIATWPKKGSKSDYRFRVWTDPESFAEGMANLAKTVTYGNFKDAAAKTSPDHAKLYHRVWSVLAELQEDGPFGWWKPSRKKPRRKTLSAR